MFSFLNTEVWENSAVVSISVSQAGRLGSRPAQSTCFRKLEFYQGAIDMFPQVLTTGSTKAVHVLSYLCDNACRRLPECVCVCDSNECHFQYYFIHIMTVPTCSKYSAAEPGMGASGG